MDLALNQTAPKQRAERRCCHGTRFVYTQYGSASTSEKRCTYNILQITRATQTHTHKTHNHSGTHRNAIFCAALPRLYLITRSRGTRIAMCSRFLQITACTRRAGAVRIRFTLKIVSCVCCVCVVCTLRESRSRWRTADSKLLACGSSVPCQSARRFNEPQPQPQHHSSMMTTTTTATTMQHTTTEHSKRARARVYPMYTQNANTQTHPFKHSKYVRCTIERARARALTTQTLRHSGYWWCWFCLLGAAGRCLERVVVIVLISVYMLASMVWR